MNSHISRYADIFSIRIFAFALGITLILAGSLLSQQIKVYPTTIRLDKGKTRTLTAVALVFTATSRLSEILTGMADRTLRFIDRQTEIGGSIRARQV